MRPSLNEKKYLQHHLGPLLLILGVFCFSALGADLSERLDKVLSRSRIRKDELGLIVGQARNGGIETIWSVQSEKSLIPASLTKLMTAAGVLDVLGPAKKLETKLLGTGEIKGETLEGDLILLGGGDPGFVSETMWFLVNEFRRTGVRAIKGDLIVDDSRFDQTRSDESRQDERVDRAFDAPVGAMSYNWNSVNIFVRAGKASGDEAKVISDPEGPYIKVEGKVKTVKGAKSQVSVERKKTKDPMSGETIQVAGQIGVESPEFVAYKNISMPDYWSGINLRHFLNERGIKLDGKVRLGRASSGAQQLARAESKSVGFMVADMLKFSNNFVAEMLVKNLAAESGQRPASLAQGVELIRKSLAKFGLDVTKIHYENPSGFTRANRISAKDLHELLVRLKERFDIFPELAAALPIGGVDGTLKSRMKGTMAEGRVRAKTGLLTGAVGLAGYAGRRESGLFSFVFIFNGRPDLGDDARRLFDQLAAELVQ